MSNDICQRVGARIRQLRKKRKLTQVELSEKCGIENSHLSRLESGQREPGLYILDLLAKGLGVSLAELFRGL